MVTSSSKDEDSGEAVTVFVKTGSGNSEVVISSTIVSRALEKREALISMNAAYDERFEGGDEHTEPEYCVRDVCASYSSG